MQQSFTIGDAISYGWARYKENAVFLSLTMLASFIIVGLFGSVDKGSALGAIVNTALNFLIGFTFIRISLMVYAEKGLHIGDIFSIDWRQFGMYVVAALIVGVLNAIGIVLLVIPGVIIAVRLSYFAFPLIEENASPIDSIKRSWSLTKGNFWKLIGAAFALFFLNLLGGLLVGVGLLVTAPITLIAMVYIYQKLKALPAVAAPEPLPMEVPKA